MEWVVSTAVSPHSMEEHKETVVHFLMYLTKKSLKIHDKNENDLESPNL